MLQKRWWRLVALPAKRSTGRGGFRFFGIFFLGYFCFSDFSVSFDFSIGVLGKSLALARRAFLFNLRRRCTKSLPSEVSLSMFTSSSSVLFLILFGVFVRFMVVFVQFPTELSSFTGRMPESLRKSPSDHMVPTLVVALPLLLLSYTYFNYNFTILVLSLSLNFSLYSLPTSLF